MFHVIITFQSIIKLSKLEIHLIFHLRKIFLQITQVKLFVISKFSKLVLKLELIFEIFKYCQFQFKFELNILELFNKSQSPSSYNSI